MPAWEDKLQRLLSPTESKWPYRIVQIKPNRQDDKEIYTLSGREEHIAANGSLFLALYDLAERDRINFEAWFALWETGFLEFTFNRADSNFGVTGDKQWDRIKNPDTRPRYRELTTPQQRTEFGYRVIEYWRDRSDEKNSILLGGVTDLMLIDRILAYEYQRSVAQAQDSVTSDIIRYSGIPKITLYFKGFSSNQNKTVTGEKQFRFMGYTDNPSMAEKRNDLELITQTDINQIGAKIQSIFRTTPPYNWGKGKEQVIYHDWSSGFNLNIYCSSHSEGERLVTAILATRNLQIDERFLKHGKAKNPIKAYPPVEEIQVLGEKHKIPERLPTEEVVFQYADIYLPTIKKTQIIS
jgi:hypothetical protein